jgi:hypothetical protein
MCVSTCVMSPRWYQYQSESVEDTATVMMMLCALVVGGVCRCMPDAHQVNPRSLR